MIEIGSFVRVLDELGTGFYTGVPCSYLNSFMNYATSGKIRYTAAASEGEAVGIATGAYLGGGQPAAVLIQNSGLGNCVNPITSLSITFEIPFLLLVSHRGEGGKDAPQHLHMGEIMYDLLGAIGVPAYTLPDSTQSAIGMLRESHAEMMSTMRPVALVARKGVFEPYKLSTRAFPTAVPGTTPEPASAVECRIARVDALRQISRALSPSDLVVATTGMTARELCAVHDRDANFYMMGSMGCAPAIGLGVALERPERKVVVIDGDGAFMMKMGVASTIGHYAPSGLLHVVLDNGTYETTGSQPTVSSTTVFEQVACAAGYKRGVRVNSLQELAEVIEAFAPGDGPVFCCLRILDGHMEQVPRVRPSPLEIRDRFRAAALA